MISAVAALPCSERTEVSDAKHSFALCELLHRRWLVARIVSGAVNAVRDNSDRARCETLFCQSTIKRLRHDHYGRCLGEKHSQRRTQVLQELRTNYSYSC